MKKREQWQSTLGFIWAAAGSAVGLGSIWRFPYIVGANGGAIFIFLFITFLIIISVPVFISEIAIGKTTRQDPAKAFQTLAQQKKWYHIGFIPIITGFLISTFYSVIGGWTLGFLYEACLGNLHQFQTAKDASLFFHGLQKNWAWGVLCHFTFVFLSSTILYSGVRKGIEKTSKLMMPTLLFVLIILSISGLFLPGASLLVLRLAFQWVHPVAVATYGAQASHRQILRRVPFGQDDGAFLLVDFLGILQLGNVHRRRGARGHFFLW